MHIVKDGKKIFQTSVEGIYARLLQFGPVFWKIPELTGNRNPKKEEAPWADLIEINMETLLLEVFLFKASKQIEIGYDVDKEG